METAGLDTSCRALGKSRNSPSTEGQAASPGLETEKSQNDVSVARKKSFSFNLMWLVSFLCPTRKRFQKHMQLTCLHFYRAK